MSAESLLLRGELRGEKRLYVLAAITIVFATAALTLALALGDTFERSFAASAKTLLGGDVALRLRQRDFSDKETQWLQQNTREVSFIRVAAALAVAGDKSQMARIKTTDDSYPLYGKLQLKNGDSQQLRTALDDVKNGVYPAAVAEELLTLLDLNMGDIFLAAGLTLQVTNIILAEPDPDGRIWMAMPLILTGEQADDNLSVRGLLSSRYARILLPAEDTTETWETKIKTAFGDADWRLRTSQRAMPGLRRFVERMRNFLSLMSLAAMLAAGIGVSGATSAFLRARTRAIAVIKMLGGGRQLIARVYLKIAALFVVSGALIGALGGAALLFWLAPYFSAALPLSLVPEWPWAAFFKALFSASLMGGAFILLPIMRAGHTNPLMLFKAGDNEQDSAPYTRRDLYHAAFIWIPVLLLMPLGWREKLAAVCILAAAALLYLLSILCARFAGAVAARIAPPVSWGLLAVDRNRKQTAAGVVSLGVGMALLVAILNIEGNFSARIDDTLQSTAPTFYLTGIHQEQRLSLQRTLSSVDAQSRLRAIPFLRGKIKSLGGRSADSIDAPPDYRWILGGDRGLTWTDDGGYIGASEVVAGQLWDKNETRPQASFDAEAAAAFDIGIGDELVLSILGERLTVVITNLRDINWQSFDINFVVILDRRPFGSAPYSLMGAAFVSPQAELPTKLAIVREYPNITPIAMSAVFDIGRRLLRNISLLLQAAAIFMLIGAVPVVVASLMDGQRRRVHDAVTLRLLGAPIHALIIKGLAEFLAIAAAALIPALIFGLIAANLIVEHIFDLSWQAGSGSPLFAAAGGIILFLLIGGISIVKWIRQPPLTLLRND